MRLVMVVALYAVPVVVCLQPGIDWDMWWHLRVGEYVVQTGTVPEHDPFSTLAPTAPWVAYSWLFEVLVYQLHRAFGLAGPLIYATALSLAVVAAVHRLVARRERRFHVAIALTGVAVLALAAVFKQRPWMVTILFSTLTLDVVLDLRASRKNRLTWLLPLMYVLWANIHIQFIYGLFILGLACVAPIIDRWFRAGEVPGFVPVPGEAGSFAYGEGRGGRSVWLLTALCTLATLLNPFHVRLYFVVVDYATQPGAFRLVNELKALEFREVCDWVMLGLAGAAVFALGRRRRLSSFEVLLLAGAAFFAFRARRDLWFLVVASLAVLAVRRDDEAPAADTAGSRHFWARVAFVAGAVALLIPAVWQARRLSDGPLEQKVAEVFPVEAAKVARQYPGPLFNDFDWGGYLIWTLQEPDHRVVVDGRTNLHGDARLSRLGATWAGAPGWHDDPDLSAAKVVIANAATPLAALLEFDTRFKCVHADDLAKVFVARP
jgi:hypothetical protein